MLRSHRRIVGACLLFALLLNIWYIARIFTPKPVEYQEDESVSLPGGDTGAQHPAYANGGKPPNFDDDEYSPYGNHARKRPDDGHLGTSDGAADAVAAPYQHASDYDGATSGSDVDRDTGSGSGSEDGPGAYSGPGSGSNRGGSVYVDAGAGAASEGVDKDFNYAAGNTAGNSAEVGAGEGGDAAQNGRPSSMGGERSFAPNIGPSKESRAKYFQGSKLSEKNYRSGMSLIQKALSTMLDIGPGVEPLTEYNRDVTSDTALHESELPPTSSVLGLYLQVSEEDVAALKETHAQVVESLPHSVPDGAFSGRGIVMTGGGKYFPMVMTAIRWVRDMDPYIPIEVFMADNSEYEENICAGLFRKLGVECRVIEDIFGRELSSKINSKYALKPLAILASRFDDIYFMDADSYPLYDLNPIFDWDVFTERGYILNSDYWPRYISPKFYDIVGIQLGERARGDGNCKTVLQSDRAGAVPGVSTESGQVFVRKTSHIRSLLLAMYYNLYGPDVYFPLLMQKGHGEGDKDTYAAAAVVLGENYFQTHRRPVTLGMHQPSGYHGFAMVQPDPILDKAVFEDGAEGVTMRYFALHANSIKSNPKHLLKAHEEVTRGYPPLQKWRFFGTQQNIWDELSSRDDLEQRFFRTMRDVTCGWIGSDGYVPLDWEEDDIDRICWYLNAHLDWLADNPMTRPSEDAPFWIDIEPSS